MSDWKYQPAADTGLPPVDRLKSVKREPGLISSAARIAASMATAVYLKTYHRLTITGREHIPESTPLVLAGNHESHLDALILATALPLRLRPQVFPIAAGDTFFMTPTSAAFATLFMNALPMWRKSVGSHAMNALRERLVPGGEGAAGAGGAGGAAAGYILFPEGTRTRTGELGRFKPGLGMLVAGTNVPIVPCWIEGAFEALPADKKLPRPGKISLRLGPALRFPQASNDREGWMTVVETVEKAVRGLA